MAPIRGLATFVFVAAGLTVFAAVLFAQPGAERVVIRASNNDGRPVQDLTAAQVSIRVDGTERKVTNLQLIEPEAGTVTALPPPYVTNVAPPPEAAAREFVIAIDDDGIASRRDEPIRDVVAQLIKTLSESDRIGLLSLRLGKFVLPPTTHHDAVLASLPKVMAMGSASASAVDLACRTKSMYESMETLLETGGPERTIVLFVAGMSPVTEETVRQSLIPNPRACEIRSRDLDDLSRVAIAASPSVFMVLFPEGAVSASNVARGEAGAELAAGAVSAELIRFTADTGPVVERITATAGTYYIATLEGAASRDARRVDVRVNRDGVRALARPIHSREATVRDTSETRSASSPSPRDMIREAATFMDLPLRADGFIARQPGSDDLRVMAIFEPDANTARFKEAAVGLFSDEGLLKAQWTARPEELRTTPVIAVLTAPPGHYRMRVAATDMQGRGGTTDVPVVVELGDARPVKVGDLVLGTDQSSPKLLFRFGDPSVIGSLLVYDVTKDMNVGVTFEVRQNERTAPIGSTAARIVQSPNEPDARLAWGGFNLQPLPPGDYLMRAIVTVNGKEAGVVSRTLRKLM